ncbi:MAG: D-aminoacyl-tRNA deacylase [bacterium]|nr:D-tyrosyl-tRNA(Tyr) deacylase [Gammaproteobacteria bacterium]HIL94571.1 D-tyrosyl-tRNA(Tyr) deacylase [Pseudomonadales bacterium]
MLGLIQRVSSADVVVAGETVGEIQRGILLLLGVQKHDNAQSIDKLLNKVLAYRIFADAKGHMNLSLTDVGGDLLVVSQFTLAANTKKGLRPSFSSAAPPELAEGLYDEFVGLARARFGRVATGVFGADMQVSLVNDGPVTFLLEG